MTRVRDPKLHSKPPSGNSAPIPGMAERDRWLCRRVIQNEAKQRNHRNREYCENDGQTGTSHESWPRLGQIADSVNQFRPRLCRNMSSPTAMMMTMPMMISWVKFCQPI